MLAYISNSAHYKEVCFTCTIREALALDWDNQHVTKPKYLIIYGK